MQTLEQIKGNEINGASYWAIAENGRKYKATYSNEYFGGIMFFCIPDGIKIIGYEKRDIKTFTTTLNDPVSILINKYGKTNGYPVNNSDWFNPIISINGKKYEYYTVEPNADGETVKVLLIEVA